MPWLTKPWIDAGALRSLPFFSSLSPDQAEEVLGSAEERRIPTGTEVIEQWQYAREFVILEGTAEARPEQQVLRLLGLATSSANSRPSIGEPATATCVLHR